MPLVSIIVPVYKVENYLDRCVASIIAQTLKDIEIILVDDGSPDNCPAMCDAWAKKDSRIQVIHKQNGGLSDARNAGLNICTGDYIGFTDSDDYIEPTMFEKLYNSAENHGSDIAVCAHYTANEDSKQEHLLPFSKTVYENEEIVRNFILPLIGYKEQAEIPVFEGFVWRQLFKKELLQGIRFQSEKRYFAEDVVFDFDVYPLSKTISVVNEPLYHYYFNEQSLSNRYRENLWEKLSALLHLKKEIVCKYRESKYAEDRLYNEAMKFIQFTLLNLAKEGCTLSGKEKKDVLKQIREDEMTAALLESGQVRKTDLKTRGLFALLQLRAYDFVLLALRWFR
ncbi:MAG: glycosyltransferase [Clostridia bacterium]|nr:glycosyltransferase [Clostridia bacterium]